MCMCPQEPNRLGSTGCEAAENADLPGVRFGGANCDPAVQVGFAPWSDMELQKGVDLTKAGVIGLMATKAGQKTAVFRLPLTLASHVDRHALQTPVVPVEEASSLNECASGSILGSSVDWSIDTLTVVFRVPSEPCSVTFKLMADPSYLYPDTAARANATAIVTVHPYGGDLGFQNNGDAIGLAEGGAINITVVRLNGLGGVVGVWVEVTQFDSCTASLDDFTTRPSDVTFGRGYYLEWNDGDGSPKHILVIGVDDSIAEGALPFLAGYLLLQISACCCL